MLTPEQLRNLPTALTDKYAELTDFILQDIARRIAKGAALTDTAEYQIYRARSLGLSTKEIAAKIAEINGEAADTIEQIILSAAATADEYDRQHLSSADALPLEKNEVLQKLISAQIEYTCGTCENLTNTLGFADHNADGTVCYRSLTDMYRREMDAAQLKVMSGATDYTTALRSAVNKLAASGVRTIDYESGSSRTVEAATRTALMTSVSQLTHQISEQNGEQMGADGWEMSAHMGARPSHKVYQGKQYTQEQYEQIIRPLINEYNCRHDVFPIILGISEPVYTDEELENIDPPPFTYEGKTYTAYEAQQQMRKMERVMRRQKDRCIVADAAGDKEGFTTASIKLRRQKDIYEDFCKAADSYTQYERTIVGGYDRHLAGKTGAVTRMSRWFDKAQMKLNNNVSQNKTINIEPDENELQFYKPVEFDLSEVYKVKRGNTELTMQKTMYTQNSIYISDKSKIKPRQLHNIDKGFKEAFEKVGGTDKFNCPSIYIVTNSEMQSTAVASYNPVTNIIYIDEMAGVTDELIKLQTQLACPDNRLSTFIHETLHWRDANEYIEKHGQINNFHEYIEVLRKNCKNSLDKIAESGYNLYDISDYASVCLDNMKYDEVYTEYRVKQILEG